MLDLVLNVHHAVHAHALRQTHAERLRGEGLDVGIISKQHGYPSILTTIRYLDHVATVAVATPASHRGWAPSTGISSLSDVVVDR